MQKLQEKVARVNKYLAAASRQEEVIKQLEDLICRNKGRGIDRSTCLGSDAYSKLVRGGGQCWGGMGGGGGDYWFADLFFRAGLMGAGQIKRHTQLSHELQKMQERAAKRLGSNPTGYGAGGRGIFFLPFS